MARPAKFDEEQILDGALRVVTRYGVAGFSVRAVAVELGAPSGSLYHRFPTRDALLGSLWLRCVERFQFGYLEALLTEPARAGAVTAAQHVVRFARSHPDEARVLILYRVEDFGAPGWPAALVERAEALRTELRRGLDDLARRLGARGDRQRVTFAVVDVPYGAVRRRLGTGERPSARIEALVAETVELLLDAPPRRST